MLPRRSFVAAAILLATSCHSVAQSYSWTTHAGLPPQIGSSDGAAANARFNRPAGLVGDMAGNIYVTDGYNHTIRRISATGAVTTIAGSAGSMGSVDGAGTSARFAVPGGIVVANGALFVADRLSHAIRRVATNGTTTTFAGRLSVAGFADGPASAARFNDPFDVVADAAGSLYVTDRMNHVIRKIANDGSVTTVAGAPGVSGSLDGTGSAARFANPQGITIDNASVLYVADYGNHTIRRITPTGAVTTLAGSPGLAGTANGTGSAARFSSPHSVLSYAGGTLLVADNGNHCIRLVSTAGVVSLYAGRLNVEGSRDGIRADARFFAPGGMAFASDGVAVADTFNYSIRKMLSSADNVSTIAGPGGNFGRLDGPGPAARFNYPNGVAVHGSGDLYLADSRGNTIRRITPEGVVTTIAGGTGDAYIDGPAGVASLNYPHGIAVAPDRTVYFCEQQRHTIRVLRPDGSVATIAGSENVPGNAGGAGSAARFGFPSGIALDRDGNLYIADSANSTIRRIAAGTTTVTTFAGLPLASGNTDGAGAAARFMVPRGLCVDGDGNVYVTDTGNHTIRKITPDAGVTTIAGLAGSSGSANGAGAAARFSFPWGIAVDGTGQLFIADSANHIIRRLVGETVSTIGGNAGVIGYADGSGDTARFLTPSGIAVDHRGLLYVSQSGNNIVTKGVLESPPVIAVQPQSASVPAGASATLSVTATGSALSYQWKRNGVLIAGATSATYRIASVDALSAGDYTVNAINPLGTTTSAVATVTIAPAASTGRIVNLSILTALTAPGDTFTLGFVVGGGGASGTKPLVIRAAGPSLAALGVAGTLDDPLLELFIGSNRTGENDNWGGSAPLALAMQSVGAFAYTGPTSRDAAVTGNFNTGDQSVKVAAAGTGTGTVIAEIYDASPAESVTSITPRLMNVSVLKHLGSGLIAGFVIGGSASKTVLVRAIGPTIGAAPFNVDGVVIDPQLTLFSGPTVITQNDNWGGTAALTAVFAQVGAFALPASSRDAAVVATLSPGNYTVEVRGVSNTTGVALVEVYDVP